ncbi:MAG: polysaccharide deacetylase family protein [Myxococcota bacterium]|nr:polysaccharide deacetylase family protein [Myxococcota bacterium]
MRERVATLLHKAGALAAVMQLRRYVPGPNLSIVTYHHIADQDPTYPYDPDVADASPAQFRRQMEVLAKYCTPIGIDELIRAVEGEPLPRNPVMVTFDDGYRSCHDVALPILRAVGVRATFFVSTSFITERRLYWWERIALALAQTKRRTATITYPRTIELDLANPKLRGVLTELVKATASLDVDRFLDGLFDSFGVEWSRDIESMHADAMIMTWDQVRALARAGMDVESHGRRHRVLQTLDDETLDDELAGSRVELEAQLGRLVRAVAYPVGRRIARQARIRDAIASAGYRIGLTNASGVNRVWPLAMRGVMTLDPFDVRRLSTDRTMSDAMFLAQVAVPQLAYIARNHD